MPIVGKCITLCKPSHNCTICKFLWLKGQPHLCFCLHERVWLLYFIPSVSKLLWNNWLKIIKHTFMNTTDSKAIRFWALACNIHAGLSLTAGSRQNKPATWVVSAGYFLVFCVFLRQIICSCTGADIWK